MRATGKKTSTKKWLVNQLLDLFDDVNFNSKVPLTAPQKAILLALSKFADQKTLLCTPGIKRLSRITSLKETAIKLNLKALQKKNIIFYVERKNDKGNYTSNEYFLHILYAIGVGHLVTQGWVTSRPTLGHLTPEGGSFNDPGVGREVSTNNIDITNNLTNELTKTHEIKRAKEIAQPHLKLIKQQLTGRGK